MATSKQRPLAGICIGISISEGEDLAARYGLSEKDISEITVELCRRFVGLGAQVALGHQWRPKGIMEEVVRFAQAYQWEVSSRETPIVRNFLAWPDRAALSEDDRKELKGLVTFDECIGQDSVAETAGLSKQAAALTAMREKMNSMCFARLCLSGRALQLNPHGVSGVLEEASDMLRRKRPVFLSGMMGGTALLLINWLQYGKVEPKDFGGNENRTKYLLEAFRPGQLQQYAKSSGLDEKELIELFNAQNLDTIVELTARGLYRLKKQ